MVVFEKKWLYLGKAVVFGQKLLYSSKSGCIRAKVVVFEHRWLLSVKSGCIRAKWFYSGKWLYSVKSGCNLAKSLYSGKNGCILAKVVVFVKKW